MEAEGRNSYYYPHPLIARHFVLALGLGLAIRAAMLGLGLAIRAAMFNILFNDVFCCMKIP